MEILQNWETVTIFLKCWDGRLLKVYGVMLIVFLAFVTNYFYFYLFCCIFRIVGITGRGVMWNCVVGTDQSNFAQPFLWQLLTWIEARKFVLNQWMPEHLSENAFRTKTFPFWQPGKKCRPLNVLLKNCPTKIRVFRVICNWRISSDLQIITASIIAKEM